MFPNRGSGGGGSTGPQGPSGLGLLSTSTSNITLQVGSLTWVLTTQCAFLPGMRVRVQNATNTVYAEGFITAYSGYDLTVDVDDFDGISGNSWTIAAIADVGKLLVDSGLQYVQNTLMLGALNRPWDLGGVETITNVPTPINATDIAPKQFVLDQAWLGANIPNTIFMQYLKTNLPMGAVPGSIGANGALTLSVSLSRVYAAGIYLWFPANAVFSGSSEGFYWTIMNGLSSGTVYNNLFNPNTTAIPSIPETPTTVSGTGTAYTLPTATQIKFLSKLCPVGTFGPNSEIKMNYRVCNTGSANTKSWRTVFGAADAQLHWYQITTNTTTDAEVHVINCGLTTVQSAHRPSVPYGSTTINSNQWTAVNLGVAGNIGLTLEMANAGEYAIIDWYNLEIRKG